MKGSNVEMVPNSSPTEYTWALLQSFDPRSPSLTSVGCKSIQDLVDKCETRQLS